MIKHPRPVLLGLAAVILTALGVTSASAALDVDDAAVPVPPSSEGAVAECLDHVRDQVPLAKGVNQALDLSVRHEANGWYAVIARAAGGAAPQSWHCSVVPDDDEPRGVRVGSVTWR